MYALVYAPYGILGGEGGSVRLFTTKDEAWEVMRSEARYWIECEVDLDPELEPCVGTDHATSDPYDPHADEWHIYEVKE